MTPSSKPCIWLIGGTQESAHLARAIAPFQIPCLITVTTESARGLYAKVPNQKVWVGRLTAEQAIALVHEQQIAAILDASHPYAVAVSELAIATAEHLQIPYLRFERPSLDLGHVDQGQTFPSFDALLSGETLEQQRVLLTIGYRPLERFQSWQDRATLFARILPSRTALEAALYAGFTSDRLIALRPPISAELEQALWQQWQISMVVTKASGTAGGEAIKQQVAAALGIPLIVITRPAIAYPQKTSDGAIATEFCRRFASP